MRQILILLFLGGLAAPALAQHAGHGASEGEVADPHAGHDMPAEQPARADPHAGQSKPAHSAAPIEEQPSQVLQEAKPVDPHALHQIGNEADLGPSPAPPPPEALTGPAHAADDVWGGEAMATSRHHLEGEHGQVRVAKFMIDRLEAAIADGKDGYAWDAEYWLGGDIDKFWAKAEGDGSFQDGIEASEVQGLWSHAIDPWFNLQVGLRQDFQPGPDRTHLVLGVEGIAPYWFEVDAALFLSNKGDLTARFEGEYDLRISQSLILQPRAELNLAAQDIPELGIGSGLSTSETGVRMRYDIVPQFAPYIGVEYERSFGDTKRFRRVAGEEWQGWSFLLGIRAWF